MFGGKIIITSFCSFARAEFKRKINIFRRLKKMVRDASRRITKYTAKIVGDVVKNRIDALKDSMVEQVTDKFAALVDIENEVKSKLNTWGVTSITVPFYLSYARRLYKLSNKHSGGTLNTEACIATKAFIDRELDPYYLQQIALDVFSLDVTACTA